MNTNHVICRNRVEVEGKDVGKLESFHLIASSRNLGNTAVLTLPLYALSSDKTFPSRRFRQDLQVIKVCAEIKIYLGYDSWNAENLTLESFPEVLAFSGWIEHIAEGFPARIYLQDNSFILRFGAIEKAWDETATLQKIMEDCIPIANAAFKEERRRLGFTRVVSLLTYSHDGSNVQATTTAANFSNWGGHSPFDTMQKLMNENVLYGGVGINFNVYVGAGVTDSTRPILALSTQTNVIERDMVQVDGRFVDFDVKVFGILKNGRQYTATGGVANSQSAAQNSAFEKAYGGEVHRVYSKLGTVAELKAFADQMLLMLRGQRNQGSIKMLLYPKVEIMDGITFTDTIFEGVSGNYYVLEYELDASEKGYFQTLKVTDKVFLL